MSALPIVDAHQHFWDTELGRHPWLCERPLLSMRYGDYGAIRRPYLPPDYLADATGFDVEATVYVETEWDPNDPIGEVAWVHDCARQHGFPNAVVAQAWLDRTDIEETLERLGEYELVRGVRHKPTQFHGPHAPPPYPRGGLSDPRFRRGYAALEGAGLAFDLQTAWWHLPEAAELARAHPGVVMILDHTGLPGGRDADAVRVWRDAMRSLAAAPNVMVKISGLGERGLPWTVARNREVVRDTIDLFGVERCMFASNFPVDRLCVDFATLYKGFAEIVEDLDLDDRRKLFAENARRIYRTVERV